MRSLRAELSILNAKSIFSLREHSRSSMWRRGQSISSNLFFFSPVHCATNNGEFRRKNEMKSPQHGIIAIIQGRAYIVPVSSDGAIYSGQKKSGSLGHIVFIQYGGMAMLRMSAGHPNPFDQWRQHDIRSFVHQFLDRSSLCVLCMFQLFFVFFLPKDKNQLWK